MVPRAHKRLGLARGSEVNNGTRFWRWRPVSLVYFTSLREPDKGTYPQKSDRRQPVLAYEKKSRLE